jgi:hypothetical protein
MAGAAVRDETAGPEAHAPSQGLLALTVELTWLLLGGLGPTEPHRVRL